MKSSKLASLIACFSKEEWDRLGHFLKLPYLDKVHKKHHQLYAYLKTYYWKRKEQGYSHGALFPTTDKLNSIFFPDAQNSKPLSKHFSKLHKNARLFLASEAAMNNSQEVELVSIRKTISQKEYHYAKLAIKRMWKQNEQETNDWHLRYELAVSNFNLQNNIQDSKQVKLELIESVGNCLDDFYIITKLKSYCRLIEGQQSLNNSKISENQKTFEDYLDYYYSKISYRPIIFQVYYNILKILRDREIKSSIETIDHLLSTNKEKFTHFERKKIQSFLLNHCTYLLHSQKITLPEVFKIYQWLLESGILSSEKDSFGLPYYLNILIIGIRIEAFTWLKEKFIPIYTNKLPIEYQTMAGNYGNAEYHFSQKDWKKAFDYAYDIPPRNKTFKLLRGAVLVQAAYEIEKSNLKDLPDLYDTLATIQNFKGQLTNKKIKVSRPIKAYRNFVKFTKRIYNLQKATNKYDRAIKLERIIQDENIVARKIWLLEKLNEFLT